MECSQPRVSPSRKRNTVLHPKYLWLHMLSIHTEPNLLFLHCIQFFTHWGVSNGTPLTWPEERLQHRLKLKSCFQSSMRVPVWVPPIPISQNHRMAWIEKDHNAHPVPTPCYMQGRQPAAQAAQSHIPPGLECLQGWGIHSLLGQPVQCVTTLWGKNFLLISNLNLLCPSLKPFSFVLSLSTLISSRSPSCLYAPFKYWKAAMRSPQSLLFSKLNKPSSLNLSL